MSRLIPENPKIWLDGFIYDRTDQQRDHAKRQYHRLRFKGG